MSLMNTLLVRNAAVLVTMDGERREIAEGGMFIRDGWIEQVDFTSRLPRAADTTVDLSGCLLLPGLINAHHHLYQTFDRACPACQSASLIDWLKGLYPRWAKMTPGDVRLAAELGLAELALSGCTTVADHQYLWPNGTVAEDLIEVARRVGLRFHLGRGFQNLGEESGGFAPASLTEKNDDILIDCERVIHRFHDNSPGSLIRVFVAPSSLRSVSPDLLRAAAHLARDHNVGFHMHLGETAGEIEFIGKKFGRRPTQLAEELGCLGPNSWIAHGVHLDDGDIEIMHRNRCGICHCPSSNMRLASGIAPIQRYRDRGINVGLGVDGSASNDSSNLLAELRLALLLSRVSAPASQPLFQPRAALELATLGGANLLGRSDIGRLETGCAADFIAVNLDRIALLGTDDPVAAVALCAIDTIDCSWVHGRPLVDGKKVAGIDINDLAERCRAHSAIDFLRNRMSSTQF